VGHRRPAHRRAHLPVLAIHRLIGRTLDRDLPVTAILSRSKTQPDRLVAKLVCESCDEVVKILGFVEHTLGPVPTWMSHNVKKAA
jgi:hypothetical protein